MDEVAFFDLVLSEADITNIMNNGLAESAVQVAVEKPIRQTHDSLGTVENRKITLLLRFMV